MTLPAHPPVVEAGGAVPALMETEMDILIARIVAHLSAPETYDPPSADDMMDRILADAGRKSAARAREMSPELPAKFRCGCCGDVLHREDHMGDAFKEQHAANLRAEYGPEVCFGCADEEGRDFE